MKPQPDVKPWPRGYCEYGWRFLNSVWKPACHKRGRWMVDGEIRCGEHKNEEGK